MVGKNDFKPIFRKLRAILKPYEGKMVVVHDTDSHYYLDTPHVMKNKRRLCFAAVRVGKAYVSFYLMPVYASPDLLKDLSPALKKRMQGKSCFNFKAVDDKLFKELGKLTKSGFQKFSDPKVIQKMTTR
ncbi:MAG: hypothetical protein H0U60_20170 [Blastocatellia bacterium]|nr:hypothetical protein [Blastocatellia bacterium]